LLAAEIVSTTGVQMTWVALPWFVLLTSGSATRMSLVMAAEIVGLAALGLPGGKVLGSLGARRTMLLADAARAPLMTVIPALYWADALSLPALLSLAFALGAFAAPYLAAQRMILPELLGETEQRVSEANALFQAATRLTLLLGPVVAGVLIGTVGVAAEWGWSRIDMPLPWNAALLPEAPILAFAAAVSGGLIGAHLGGALRSPRRPSGAIVSATGRDPSISGVERLKTIEPSSTRVAPVKLSRRASA
jgi:MFS family permease